MRLEEELVAVARVAGALLVVPIPLDEVHALVASGGGAGGAGHEAVLHAEPFPLHGVGAPVLADAVVHVGNARSGEARLPAGDAGGGEDGRILRGQAFVETQGLHHRGAEELTVVIVGFGGAIEPGDISGGVVECAGAGFEQGGGAALGDGGGYGEGEVGRGVLVFAKIERVDDRAVLHVAAVLDVAGVGVVPILKGR